ncbi:16S rRNA (guanine(527)-N(7))-methyltransferase RsmG [Pelagibacteraceae bacterium]|nr:16S rRNA (guanine(527)-N(7))-methyltransferase RsmG [Pelagibacteraceae bacterium]
MMPEDAKNHLIEIGFNSDKLKKIEFFSEKLLEFNLRYNLIGKSTESIIWSRHILDSAQIVKYIDFSDNKSLSDLGTGGGFPGIIISIYNDNNKFHVKLYEKSPVKSEFLENIVKFLDLRSTVVKNDIYSEILDSEYITARAFKKIDKIISISRENKRKKHKIIILKGKNAREELNKAFMPSNYSYKLENSMTDRFSKIIILEAT